jgi:hypothetical protein
MLGLRCASSLHAAYYRPSQVFLVSVYTGYGSKYAIYKLINRCFLQVRAGVSQQQHELVKGPYNPTLGKRGLVAQPELKTEQVRRAVYCYRTKEKSALKVKQYNDRLASLARREGTLD